MKLLLNDKKIFKKYTEIWNKSLIKKDFNSEPVYNDKYINIKTKIKFSIQHNKIPKLMNVVHAYLQYY